MNTVVKKNAQFFMVVGGILIVLMVLFLSFGYLKHEREKDLARNTGNDEQSRIIRDEADEYRIANGNQQIGILAAGGAVVLVAVVWWVGQRRQGPEQ